MGRRQGQGLNAQGRQHAFQHPALASLGLGLLALLLFCAGAGQVTVIGFDSRFVLFAKEMLRHGPGFFPTTYGQPYADYSSASTLLIDLFAWPQAGSRPSRPGCPRPSPGR